MISELVRPVLRRGLLDLLEDVGGDVNHEALTVMLNQLGHSAARADVLAEITWLAGQGLVLARELGHFTVAEITGAGRDVAAGTARHDGVSRHRTGI